jgi:hypothetical protein
MLNLANLESLKERLEEEREMAEEYVSLISEALVFIDRLLEEDYDDDEEKENCFIDLQELLKDINIDIESEG